MKIKLLILFSFFAITVSAQQSEFRDTLFYQVENGSLFLYNYRIFDDGTQTGLIGGSFRAPADTTSAINFSEAQFRQLARSYANGERNRIPGNVFADGKAQIVARALAQFNVKIDSLVREAEKPNFLTYKVNAPTDTTFYWTWRLLRSTGVGSGQAENVRILEFFNTKVLRLVLQDGITILVMSVDDTSVFRISALDGSNATFIQDSANPNRWVAYNTGRGISYQLIRRPSTRIR